MIGKERSGQQASDGVINKKYTNNCCSVLLCAGLINSLVKRVFWHIDTLYKLNSKLGMRVCYKVYYSSRQEIWIEKNCLIYSNGLPCYWNWCHITISCRLETQIDSQEALLSFDPKASNINLNSRFCIISQKGFYGHCSHKAGHKNW